ncbi:MAG: hypothetical protein J6T47_03075, partial [Lachnospiraceae bacterium]|nr:hypothetical protein [Lachnospiraceae bacterium]
MNSRRKKYNGQEKSWWLRSRVDASTTKAGAIRVGDGAVFTKEIDANDTGVSPAININLSRVLFVSIVSSGSNGPEYKLTVIDENGLSLQLQDHRSVTTSQDLIRVPYSLSGSTSSKLNKLSILILYKEYSRENKKKATILGYQRMEPSNPDGRPEASGYGTFMLPSNLDLSDWGKSYHVYMTAEVVNGKYETDYASAPVELPAPKSAAGLSTSAIAGPRTGQAGAAWHGNHVWFGKYDGFPIRYRVLDPNTNKYGVSTMLLDSDYILFNAPFDKDGIANEGLSKPNEWAYSELWWYLNGDDFLNNTNCFTSRERFAITGNRTTGHDLVSGTTAGCVSPSVKSTFGKYVPITSEPIFLLDVEDVSNIAYGYYYGAGNELSRMKIRIPKGESDDDLYPWLLRSASVGNNASVGKVCVEGEIETANVKNTEIGISPAFNLSRTEILFSTRVKALAGETAEYKLTLMDTFMMINVKQGEVVDFMGSDDGMTILVPYVLSGPSTNTVTNLSAMILDKEFKPGNANNAKVLRYEEMIPVESYSLETSGEAQFGLPHTFDLSGWNKDYFVYIFPEDINGVHETDYAGEPVLLPAPNAPVINTQPKDVRAIVGEDVTFSVVTTGIGGISYQWQSRKDDSSAWANSTRSGATTRKLTFKAAAGLDGWQFRCIATDANGRKTISRTARLTIVPGFVQEPTDLIVPAGSTAKFSVKASGVG